MIEKEYNFFEYVYDLFYKFAQSTSENTGLVFSRNVQYPSIELLPEIQVTIPLPKKHGETYIFEGMVFDDTEDGRKSMWCLFLATIFHMAAHACVSNYQIYEAWKRNKTQEICLEVIDFIEDMDAERYILHAEPEIWKNIQNINSKLSLAEAGHRHMKSSSEKHGHAKPFDQGNSEKIIAKIRGGITDDNADIRDSRKILFADLLYKNRELLSKSAMPYCEHREYQSAIKTEKKGIEVSPIGDEFSEGVSKIDELWIRNEQDRAKMLRKYKKHLKNLNFDTVAIPHGDLHNYLKIKDKTLPLLRRIRQQLRMIANLTDDPKIDQIGYVDMQMAIQALASEGQSQDIFERDELRRGEEAWVILIDKSASMSLRFDQIKEFAVCVAESASELTGKHDAWALYSFDNNFQILKDFKERYNQEIKARIGSLRNGGLSLLPDAIELANRILNEDPRERKYIFVITDGHPSGYLQIQEAFSKIVRKTEVSDTTLIAVGVSKGVTGSFRNNVKGHDLKQLVSKFITAYKTVASSD